jgi:hypothetical protein
MTAGASGTGAVKRNRDVLTLESYEPEAEYEVDGSGVVVVRKTGASPMKKKQVMDGKSPARYTFSNAFSLILWPLCKTQLICKLWNKICFQKCSYFILTFYNK